MSFVEQLRTHLRFITTSCEEYDLGHKQEALRIAVSLRVLFHDTRNSRSILKHLNMKESINLMSTIGTGKNHQDFESITMISIPLMLSMDGVKPSLEDHGKSINLKVEDWWNEIIMKQGIPLSRKDVALAAANQDGGAHVDSNPDAKTRDLKEGIGTFTKTVNGVEVTEDLVDHHFPLLRQLGYEVLNSPELVNLV